MLLPMVKLREILLYLKTFLCTSLDFPIELDHLPPIEVSNPNLKILNSISILTQCTALKTVYRMGAEVKWEIKCCCGQIGSWLKDSFKTNLFNIYDSKEGRRFAQKRRWVFGVGEVFTVCKCRGVIHFIFCQEVTRLKQTLLQNLLQYIKGIIKKLLSFIAFPRKASFVNC